MSKLTKAFDLIEKGLKQMKEGELIKLNLLVANELIKRNEEK